MKWQARRSRSGIPFNHTAMIVRKFLLVCLFALASPAVLGAQRDTPRPPAHAPAARAALGPIQALLEHRAELRLSDAQVARLEEIDVQMRERNRPLVDELSRMRQAMREQGPPRAELTAAQLEERRRQHAEAARPLMKRIRQHNHEAMRQVGEVLNEEQKQRVREILDRERVRRPGPGAGHPSEGHRDGSRRPHGRS
jgi:hypothetical protein